MNHESDINKEYNSICNIASDLANINSDFQNENLDCEEWTSDTDLVDMSDSDADQVFDNDEQAIQDDDKSIDSDVSKLAESIKSYTSATCNSQIKKILSSINTTKLNKDSNFSELEDSADKIHRIIIQNAFKDTKTAFINNNVWQHVFRYAIPNWDGNLHGNDKISKAYKSLNVTKNIKKLNCNKDTNLAKALILYEKMRALENMQMLAEDDGLYSHSVIKSTEQDIHNEWNFSNNNNVQKLLDNKNNQHLNKIRYCFIHKLGLEPGFDDEMYEF